MIRKLFLKPNLHASQYFVIKSTLYVIFGVNGEIHISGKAEKIKTSKATAVLTFSYNMHTAGLENRHFVKTFTGKFSKEILGVFI